MKLTEAEMRMVFQIESTNQNAALNEIYMTWRYAPNPATKETAESLLDKLRPLSDQECMDLIRKVQSEYRLPEKARTIGEMLAEARQQSGAQKLSCCPSRISKPCCGASSQKKVLTCSLMEYSSAFLRFFRSSDVLNPK